MFIVVRIRVVFLPDSGMKEDLNLYGNELNFANALWSAAYVFGQIPSNLLLTRVRHDASHIKYLLTVMTPRLTLATRFYPGQHCLLHRFPRIRLDYLHIWNGRS